MSIAWCHRRRPHFRLLLFSSFTCSWMKFVAMSEDWCASTWQPRAGRRSLLLLSSHLSVYSIHEIRINWNWYGAKNRVVKNVVAENGEPPSEMNALIWRWLIPFATNLKMLKISHLFQFASNESVSVRCDDGTVWLTSQMCECVRIFPVALTRTHPKSTH